MTDKQRAVINEYSANQYNLSKTMRKVGYTDATSKAGNQYKRLRKITKIYFDEDSIKRDIRKANKMCIKAEDITNLHRNLELQARVSGLLKPDNTIEKSIDRLIIIDKTTPLPIDNSIDTAAAKSLQDNRLSDTP